MHEICMYEHRGNKENFQQSLISQTFCPHSLWFPTAVRTKGADLRFTSNQPKYLQCFVHFKQLPYSDMQDRYQVWTVASFFKAALFQTVLVWQWGLWQIVAISFFFDKSSQLHLTVEWNLTSISRSPQLLPKFSDCKIWYQKQHLKHFCHNNH